MAARGDGGTDGEAKEDEDDIDGRVLAKGGREVREHAQVDHPKLGDEQKDGQPRPCVVASLIEQLEHLCTCAHVHAYQHACTSIALVPELGSVLLRGCASSALMWSVLGYERGHEVTSGQKG